MNVFVEFNNYLIGVVVKCKEDFCFLIGVGQYMDDVVYVYQFYVVFLCLLYVYVCIKYINVDVVCKYLGVLVVFIGEDLVVDKVNGLLCGWFIYSIDGMLMKELFYFVFV